MTAAGRLADAARAFRMIQFRNGPGHDDLSKPQVDRLTPGRQSAGGRPIAVLVDGFVFSAGETFVLGMATLPHAVVVGTTTGGGSGAPVTRELSNGWTYTVPTWLERDMGGRAHEGVGITPDVASFITTEDASLGVDSVVEEAVRVLTGQLEGASPWDE